MRALLTLLALLAPTSALAQFGYEDLARTTALSAADEHRVGQGYLDMMGWLYTPLQDQAVVAEVEAVTRSIIAHSDKPDMFFEVLVVDDAEVNAAAIPGGFLLVNKGLLDALTPEQVAFVIAHEISHVQLRHFATTMNMTRAMEVMSAAQASHASGSMEEVMAHSEEMHKMTTHYSRNLELEADLYGMVYAVRAGYGGQVGVEAMKAMKEVVGEIPEFMKDVSTHPPFSQRIDELEKGLTTILETHGQFDAGIAYARAGEYEACARSFQSFLSLFPKSPAAWSNLGTCYLEKALQSATDDPWHDDLPLNLRADVTVRSAADKGALERARSAYGKALAIDPNRPGVLAALGVLARHEGDPNAAALLDKALELAPDTSAYLNNLGNVYAAAGDARQAEQQYRKALKADRASPKAQANLARLIGAKKKGRKEAITLYEGLLEHPGFANEAHAQLVAYGARAASSAPPEPAVELAEDELLALFEALLGGLEQGGARAAEPPSEPGVVGVGSLELPPESAPPGALPNEADRTIGALSLGSSIDDFKKALGAPDFEDSQEDGYFAYATWSGAGVSVVFLDGLSGSIELFAPFDEKTARGIAIGGSEEQVRKAYGPPQTEFGDRDLGFWTLGYDSLGHAFFFGVDSKLASISLWSS